MIANPNQQVMRSLQHDAKIWSILSPCDHCHACDPANEDKFPRSTDVEIADSVEDVTLRDRKNLYYGSHNSNLYVRVHDAVRESVWYLREMLKTENAQEGATLGDFDEDSRQFFNDLESQPPQARALR